MAESRLREGQIFGIGNPLLDMQCHVKKEFLEKWGLKEDDAILCDDKHVPMFVEMKENFKVEYVAGGATQNALRVAQWIMRKPHVATFMGSVGTDEYADILEEKAREVGLNVMYQKQPSVKTGTCAVLVYEEFRSLCAHLAAANLFSKEHFEEPEHRTLMEKADIYYIAGFPLTVCPDVMLEIAEFSHRNNKTFMLNLSAPFICQFFKDPMMKLFPYVDLLFGNESEAEAFSVTHNLGTTDVAEIAVKISQFPKANSDRSRVVIITQGSKPVVVVENGVVSTIVPPAIDHSSIVDTNGAGDAFVGGFLAQFARGKPLQNCVNCGCWAAQVVIRRSGCTFPKECDYKDG